MSNPSGLPGPRWRRAVAIAVAVASVVAGVLGVWGLIARPGQPVPGPARPGPAPTSAPALPDPPPATPTDEQAQPAPTPGLPAGGDPEVFARQVAGMVFDWDTTTGDRASVVERLVAIGDPVGEETAGLVSDLGGYLPDQATWATLRDMDTRQWVTIDTLAVPTSWGQAVAEATDGELRPGVTAYTITGTRHREGVWRSEPASFSAPVAFTMFLTCPPGTGECHLLRLSALGKTLD